MFTDDAILVEVMIRGTHLGGWRGLRPTGRRVEFPLCGVYTFDAEDRLAGEKSTTIVGRSCGNSASSTSRKPCWGNSPILATHPATIARALARKFWRK